MTSFPTTPDRTSAEALLARAETLRQGLAGNFRDQLVEALYDDAKLIADRAVKQTGDHKWDFDQRIDRLITSPLFGLPLMLLLLAVIFWITIIGANYPSQMLAVGLFAVEDFASNLFDNWGAPWWLTGFVWHGVYRGLAWVVAVMLPPMLILLPHVHHPRRPRLLAPRRLQP